MGTTTHSTNTVGKLLLLPNLLGEMPHHEPYLPASVDRAVEKLDGLIAESEKGGLRFLKRFKTKKLPHQTPLSLFNEHTKEEDIDFLLQPLQKGEVWGLISDAGLPLIADPGYLLVKRARALGITVQAFSGPSSLLLALMLSGLPGESFYFHGYLPKDREMREQALHRMEKMATTHIFIEAPYRNQQILETLLETLSDQTELAVAWDLTLPTQSVVSYPVATWKKFPPPNIDKKPAIFLFHAAR